MLWVGFAVLTAVIVWVLLRPLTRAETEAEATRAADIEVYKAQLVEIEADRERGTVDAAEAEATRAEIARRLLKSAADGRAPRAGGKATADKPLMMVLGGGIPIVALAVYLFTGSPNIPAQPHASRPAMPEGHADVATLMTKVEAKLKTDPNDGRGWEAIAPIYLKLGRFDDSVAAYARALELLGENEARLFGYAEANVVAGNGAVNDGARRAFTRLLELNPKRFEARFGLALAKEQEGDKAGALEGYQAILQLAPPDAQWRMVIEERITELGGTAPAAPPVARAPEQKGPRREPEMKGPSREDVAAAGQLTPEQRQDRIVSMVEGLAQRLKTDGKNLSGWLQLTRSYVVLGRKSDAVAAIAEARKNFSGDDKSLAEIDALAKSLGLGS